MAAQARYIDFPFIRRGKERPWSDREGANVHGVPIVHAVDFLDVPAIHHPFVAHQLSASATFLGGLEKQNDGPVEIARLAQILDRPQKHGCMIVMAAGMHGAGDGRRILDARLFLYRQRVHVGS